MSFNSFDFLIFFPLLAAFYWIIPARFRRITLLVASYFFYINIKPVFAVLLAGITISTYVFTRLIDATDQDSKKRTFLVINVILILLPLLFYKYFVVINESIFTLMESMHLRWPLPEIKYILPVGISFYTFMAIGYTIDVYNEEIECERNLGIVALFISFFPLILSGPIERAKNMIPQFKAVIKPEYEMWVVGLKMMLWGYFMKLVVAARLGIYVDAVFDNIPQHNGTSLAFASFLYPFQVYADLGGYSLIAIGTAKILGIRVMQNFKRPFFASSMSEFWRRWHISLISWLTDYVYTPLTFAFRKYKIRGIVISLMLTFLISGIWHAAAITYIIWGLMQGIFLSIEAVTRNSKAQFEKRNNLNHKNWYIIAGIILTFILFSSSEIFGRAHDVGDAFSVFKGIFTSSGPLFIDTPSTFIYIILGLSLMLLKDFTDEFMPSRFLFFENRSRLIRLSSYVVIIILILLIGVFDGGQFIYFQF